MNIDIHKVKEIVRGRIVKHTNDRTGKEFYTMRIVFIYDELGTCRERYNEDVTMWGHTEIDTTITLYADSKETLKVKYKALI